MTDTIALIHKDADSNVGISFPDFPGCVTAGRTLEEARALAAEALALHVDGMIEDGEPLPSPSSLDAVMAERENRDAIAFLVPLPARPSRAVRVNITLPEDVLAAIDRHAETHGMTRSGLIAAAAKRMVGA